MYVRTYDILEKKKKKKKALQFRNEAQPIPVQAIYMWTLLKHIVLVALARVDQIKHTEFK